MPSRRGPTRPAFCTSQSRLKSTRTDLCSHAMPGSASGGAEDVGAGLERKLARIAGSSSSSSSSKSSAGLNTSRELVSVQSARCRRSRRRGQPRDERCPCFREGSALFGSVREQLHGPRARQMRSLIELASEIWAHCLTRVESMDQAATGSRSQRRRSDVSTNRPDRRSAAALPRNRLKSTDRRSAISAATSRA